MPKPDDILPLEIEIYDSGAAEALKRLGSLDRVALMEAVGADVAKWGAERIRSRKGAAPDGQPWQSLAASTIEKKRKKGKGHMGTLMQRPQLLNSIVFQDADEDSVSIGSNMVYARIHQKGGFAGRGKKVAIPARPYLGISAHEMKLLKEKLALWIGKLAAG